MASAESLEFIEETLDMATTDSSVSLRLSAVTGALHMLIRYIRELEAEGLNRTPAPSAKEEKKNGGNVK